MGGYREINEREEEGAREREGHAQREGRNKVEVESNTRKVRVEGVDWRGWGLWGVGKLAALPLIILSDKLETKTLLKAVLQGHGTSVSAPLMLVTEIFLPAQLGLWLLFLLLSSARS